MMGLDTKRPPLPAPTEPSTLSSADNDTTLRDDLDTNLSARTDKTSYSIPEDGTPITVNTTRREGGLHKKYPSQTSLLIEYFEGGKGDGKLSSRPSVRVRVTPSSRKNKTSNDHLKITQTSRNSRKPSYTRRISLGGGAASASAATATQNTEISYSDESNVSSLPPVEIEVLQNSSDVSSHGGRLIPLASDISSMPPDSMLEGTPEIKSPTRRRSRSLEREAVTESVLEDASDTLKAPRHQRSRSLSKERITQRVMEKLQQQQQSGDGAKLKDTSRTSREDLTATRKSHRKSRGSREEEIVSAISGAESSLLSSNVQRRSGDTQSMRSGVSGTSSINNPKLLATVEDAIKRLILPELNALKEEQRTQQNRYKFERLSRDSAATYDTVESSTSSKEVPKRRISKSSSAPHMHGSKPKVVLNRDGDDPGTILSGNSSRRERRSSRGSTSDRSYAESTTEEKVRRRRSKDKHGVSAREAALAGLAGAGLTAAALKHHNSREEKDDRKERRRRHSRSSRSRTASISESVDDDQLEVPPLPFNQSELQGSELTRDSILSAETETKERPESRSSRGTGVGTPLHEVARGIASPTPRTPTRTPIALQRGLGTAHSNRSHGDLSVGTPKSDRSYSARSREVTSASLEAAAAAKARALESAEPQVSQYEIAEQTPPRGLSPIQSEASYQDELLRTNSPRGVRSFNSRASLSSIGRRGLALERPGSNLSIQSLESSPSTKAARTRRRPQGVNLESTRQVLGEPSTPRDVDEFFEQNHEQNELYRRELESSQIGSPNSPGNYQRLTNYTDDSAEGQYLGSEEKVALSQDIRKVGSNPEYVHTPIAVESAVASLHEPSNISVRSSVSSPYKKSRLSQVSPAPQHYIPEEHLPREQPSAEGWINAQTLDKSHPGNSPRQSLSESIDSPVKMHSRVFPGDDHMMPEIGYIDDESEVTTNPSIIKGPIGGYNHDNNEALLSRQDSGELTPTHSYSKAMAGGAGAAAIAAAAAHHLRDRDESPVAYEGQRQATVEDDYDQHYAGEPQYGQSGYPPAIHTPSDGQAAWKDEGYQSANHPEGYTPQFRGHAKLLEDDEFGDEYDDTGLGGADLFAANSNPKHGRHFSGNSHGMASPLYDAATGKGIDRIQSKDIVALMDHLTVRDAQRNARDTEILVTLVRSAAEMRNQLDEMKQFMKTQDAMIMNNTDRRVDLAEQRILGGPRPQPPSSSSHIHRSSSEEIDVDTKRKNVFKRALKGLSIKGDSDMKKIEAMLIQLLGEVEGLKETHKLSLEQHNRSNSLTSYENLRASGDPGYEPEGRANTASSPNQSGYLSNPSSRRIQDMHSGFDVVPTNRISTVQEDDEEYDDPEPQYENTERMTTPTQEARRNNSMSQETPPQASRAYRESQSLENTPKRKHKSNSSSIFGIPKISRWSKTTASTNQDSLPRNSGSGERQSYSAPHSRSGSQVNVAYYDDQYELRDDDRLRSNTSLVRDERDSIRSPSPLIPEEPEYTMDDPKYQAHRNSLNLQHPQPRPGPTGRHQSHLESQAHIFDPVRSPDYDQWGSNPSLARNRLSGGAASQGAGHLSPISSDGGYSQHSASEQQQAPPRPPKIRDDGPLIPQQQQPLAGHGQTRQMYSSTNEFGSQGALQPLAPIAEVRYSLETDTGHHVSATPSPRPSNHNLNPAAAMASPQRKITGPRPMGSRSPSGQQGLSGQAQLTHSDTVIRRKPVAADQESLQSYRSSLDSEIF